MKHKILAALMACMLLFCSMPCAAFIDTEGSTYEEAVDVLCELGIIEGTSEDYFEPAGSLTRAQMVTIAVRLYGVQNLTPEAIFEDVPADHWAAGAVAAGHKMGIINGVSKSHFMPDDAVTFAQAVKMLICVLGYDVQAEAQGGYPSGYIAVASRLGLIKGVSEKMNRGDMAKLVYSALYVPLFEGVIYDGEGALGYGESEETILTKYLHLKKITGIVMANAYENIGTANTSAGQISIEGEKLYVGTTDIENYIGQKVTAYAAETDGEEVYTVKTFRAAKKAETKTLLAKQVLAGTTKTRLHYELEGGSETKYLEIADNARLMYNGAEKENWTAEDLQPAVGTITWIANEGAVADMLIVWNYTTFVVTGRDEEQSILFVKDLSGSVSELQIPEGEAQKRVRVEDKNGIAKGITDITEDAIVSAAFDADGVLRKLIVSKATVTGTVTEISDEIVIDQNAYAADDTLLSQVSVGDKGLFYLDHAGRIVLLDESAQPAWKYGYIVRAGISRGIEKTVSFKVFTEDGTMEVFRVADTVEINDLRVDNTLLFENAYSLTDAQKIAVVPLIRSGEIKEQLIRFEINTNGEIYKVCTAKDGSGYTDEEREAVFTKDWSGDQTMYLGHTLKSFNSRHMMTDKSIIFRVPAAYNDENDKEYAVQKMANLTHAEIYKDASIYDLTEYNDIGVLVLRGGGSTDKNVGNYAMVVGTGRGLMEDGTACETLRLYDSMGGGEMLLYNPDEVQVYFRGFALTNTEGENAEEHIVNEGGTIQLREIIAISDLHPGDIIKYAENGGVLTSVTCLLRAKTPVVGEKAYEGTSMKWPSEKMDYYPTLYLYSEAKKVSERTFKFDVPLTDGEIVERVHVFSTAPVLIFDTEKETYRVASAAAMREGDTFFAARSNPYENLIVIYR